MDENTPAQTGRPTIYTPELGAGICDRLARGESLRAICRDEGMPSDMTVRRWALEDRDGFAARYARARELQAHALADELLEIADDGTNDWMERQGKEGERNPGYELNGEHVQRSRLRVDSRKWLLSKMLPKVYGDKLQQEHTGVEGGPVSFVIYGQRVAKDAEEWSKAYPPPE